MKFSKKIMMTLFISFFISGTVFTIVSSKELKIDINNAIQTVQNIILFSWINEWKLTVEDSKLKIFWDNFVINSGNEIRNSKDSSILWWNENVIDWWKASLILWWRWNNIEANNSFIWWWSGNNVYSESTGSVIMWWDYNVIKAENSVAIWNSNQVNGSNSVVIWNNSNVYLNMSHSVAMWSGAIVNWNNSFLWSDWIDEVALNEDNVFVVMSQNGMVVWDIDVDEDAKLNIWWSFVILTGEADKNIQCGNEKWAWIVKMVDRDNIPDQKCLCSCNGENWISMFWNGQCETICKWYSTELHPGCPVWKWISKFLSWDGIEYFSWACLSWAVIEWSYYLTWDTVYWVCQSQNGNVTTCSYKSECKWNIPEHAKINNNIVPSIDLLDDDSARNYAYNEDKSQICSYSCDEWYTYQDPNKCMSVCNKTNRICNFWDLIKWPATLEQEYIYECKYNDKIYRCDVKCDVGQIWNGTACIFEREICGSDKYTCSYWEVYDTWTDVRNFIWKCKSDNGNIGTSCSKPKEIVNRTIYYSNNLVNGEQYVYFYTNENDITKDIKITLKYNNWNQKKIFTIPSAGTSSKKEIFGRDVVLLRPEFDKNLNVWCEVENGKLYVPIGEKLYILNVSDDISFCASSCSTAWMCTNGATLVGSLNSSLSSNKATFTWKCTKNWIPKQCSTSCEVDAWQCTMPSNAERCDPSSDPNCKILSCDSNDINLSNFYMDVSDDKIVWSKCGDKRHCVQKGGYIECSKTREICTQEWFKCKEWYVLSGSECKLDICDTSQDPWSCKFWRVQWNLSDQWKTEYRYNCVWNTTQIDMCVWKCKDGKVWGWTGCVLTKQLCETTHYNCKNGSKAESTQYVSSKNKYSWTCRLWNSTESCVECKTWYVSSGDVCIKKVIDCETWKDSAWYNIPFMKNGTQTIVQKYTRNSICKKTVKCETWEVKKISEKCENVCNTWTYLWTCITWFNVYWSAYNWNTAESMYNYNCWDSINQKIFSDKCYANCPMTGSTVYAGRTVKTYWIDGSCREFIIWTGYNPGSCDDRVCRYNFCGENHYNCVNGGKLVSQSESTVEKRELYETITTYTWKCHMWDLPDQSCKEDVRTSNWCKKTTTWGYTIKVDMNLGETQVVTKTAVGNTCTGTAVCETGGIVIKNEVCTGVCPWWVLNAPKCNYGWNLSGSNYQGPTWTSWYTYKCDGVVCSANCPNNKVWNGSACVNKVSSCNNNAGTCNQWNLNTVSNGTWWTTWNCKDINGNNLNTWLCYRCNNGYLWNLSENKCTPICGDGASSSPCNWWYTATWQVWWNGYTLWWINYLCKSTANSIQCSCPVDTVWNWNKCSIEQNSLCDNSKKNGCNNAYPVNSRAISGGYIWDCRNAIATWYDCHLCNEGEWNEETKTCKSLVCGWTEPKWNWVIKNSSYWNGPTDWTYVDDPDFNVMSAGCTWKCDSEYIVNDDETGCVLDTGPQCWSATTDSNWMPRKNKNNLCAQWSYSNGKVVFSYNGRNWQHCVPYYQWKCNKWSESITCKKEEVNVAWVSFSNDPYWEIWKYYNGLSPYNWIDWNDVTDWLQMTVRWYADADPEGSNTTVLAPNLNSWFEKTIEVWNQYSNQDITNWSNNDLYCFVGISFEPKIYSQSDWDEFVIYPTFDRAHIAAFRNCQSSVCPSEFSLDPS